MFEAVALTGDRHDACVMQQAIEQCSGERGILSKGRIPLTEGQIAGDDQTAFFVAGRNHLEEQVGLLPAHRQIADFVNDQQAIAVDGPMHDALQLILRVRGGQCQ